MLPPLQIGGQRLVGVYDQATLSLIQRVPSGGDCSSSGSASSSAGNVGAGKQHLFAARFADVEGLSGPGSLQAVLAAALPPGAGLCSLEFHDCFPRPGAYSGCTMLSTLTSLSLRATLGPADTAMALETMLAQAPQLSALRLTYLDLSSGVLHGLAALQRLSCLALHRCSLGSLPAGPYPCELQVRAGRVAGKAGGADRMAGLVGSLGPLGNACSMQVVHPLVALPVQPPLLPALLLQCPRSCASVA